MPTASATGTWGDRRIGAGTRSYTRQGHRRSRVVGMRWSTALFWGRARARILIEASTESEWVAQHLESLGHEVIVADPNFGLMYGHRSGRVKTDRRDVAALAEACRHGIYRPAHRRSARQRTVQWHLNIRHELVDARTRAISVARAITRGAGYRISGGAAETFLTRLGVRPSNRRESHISSCCASGMSVAAVSEGRVGRPRVPKCDDHPRLAVIRRGDRA
jgi:transposase